MRIKAEEEQRSLNEQISVIALEGELEHDGNLKWLQGCG
jgi:hypothetical protein